MGIINFVGLGGMSEVGCKLYIIEHGNDIYIFDVGMKYPEDILFGIDKVIPDMTYLKNNRKKIRGIFISNISDNTTGALQILLKDIQAPIYASEFTNSILAKELMSEQQEFITMLPTERLTIGSNVISAFELTYSVPGNFGFVLETPDGNFVYISDYVFNQNVPQQYQTNLAYLGALASKKITALISPIKGAETLGYGANNNGFIKQLKPIVHAAQGAVFVNVFTKNFLIIQQAISIAEAAGKKVCIIGKKGYELVNIGLKTKALYMQKNTLMNIKKSETIDRDKIMFLVLGDEGVPYELMLHILSDTHRDVQIKEQDVAVIAVPKVAGSELKVSSVVDALFKKAIPTKIIDPKNVMVDTAGIEDMKMLYNFIQPKYLIASDAEFRQLIEYKTKMTEIGVPEKNIIFADNGEWISFDDYRRVKSPKKAIHIDEVLVNGTMIEESDNNILKEREQLSADGVVILTVALLEANEKYKSQYVNYQSQGFIPAKDQKNLIVEIKNTVNQTVDQCNEKAMKLNDLKRKIQDNISQTIYREIKRYPIVVVQFILQAQAD